MPELSSFHDVLFPTAVSFGATGGPERRVEIVGLVSGRERRNLRTAQARRRYDAGTGVKSLDDLYEVLSFFEARRGPLHAFRFRDPFDQKSCRPNETPSAADQPLGASDGARTRFLLVKTYGTGEEAERRPIRKPVAGSLAVAVNGAAVSGWNFDVTGEVVFAEPPPANAVVTAGFSFDVPVRFDAERLEVSLTAFRAGQIPTIPLIEVRL
ncbi:MAG TPA: DUF2460 domain-containing protein [Mesorhizobium sp.]|jgi:uncharacterized protein (TIGR02217 family)|nr:DUF2460 domain-containing protein [Mesorhizobium sp.]